MSSVPLFLCKNKNNIQGVRKLVENTRGPGRTGHNNDKNQGDNFQIPQNSLNNNENQGDNFQIPHNSLNNNENQGDNFQIPQNSLNNNENQGDNFQIPHNSLKNNKNQGDNFQIPQNSLKNNKNQGDNFQIPQSPNDILKGNQEGNFQTSCRTLNHPNEIKNQAQAILNTNDPLIPLRKCLKNFQENKDKNYEEISQSSYPSLDTPVQGDNFQIPRPRELSGTKREGELVIECNESKENTNKNPERIFHSSLDILIKGDSFQFPYEKHKENLNNIQEENFQSSQNTMHKDSEENPREKTNNSYENSDQKLNKKYITKSQGQDPIVIIEKVSSKFNETQEGIFKATCENIKTQKIKTRDVNLITKQEQSINESNGLVTKDLQYFPVYEMSVLSDIENKTITANSSLDIQGVRKLVEHTRQKTV